ncbi:hypothetical protein C8R47DRAFT_1209694 [Mycena vitilis]|nr:hypothetical protein C8R47DRAFT_1209690 [Mycena vitilis]KAJ6505742.1 hypothetical protein C8R47DRAFT_1209694 [Mycena vitilis]
MSHETGCLFSMFRCCCLLGRVKAKSSSDLVRAVMQFLLRAEDATAHKALQEKLAAASTTPEACRKHASSDAAATGLKGLRPAKFRSHWQKPNLAARKQPWPRSLADIGLDHRSCSELVEIFTAVDTNPFGEEFMGSLKVIQHICHTLAGAMTFHEHPVPPISVDFFRRSVKACFVLSNGMHVVDAEFTSRHAGWSEGLFDIAVRIIPLLAQHMPDMDHERVWFSEILDRVHLAVPDSLLTRSNPTAHSHLLNDDYFQARFEMTMSARRHKCMNLGCNIAKDMAATSTLCAQCGVISYCSTQCQKSAWHAATSPHKGVCTLIAGVRQRLGEKWRKWLMRTVTSASDVRSTFREKGVTPRTCRAIWLHLQPLNRNKGLIPKDVRIWTAKALRARSLESIKEIFSTAYIEDFEADMALSVGDISL